MFPVLQRFDRHLALVLQVLSEVHGGHATFAQVAFDPVTVRESGRELGGDLGHEKSKIRAVFGVRERVAVGTGYTEPSA